MLTVGKSIRIKITKKTNEIKKTRKNIKKAVGPIASSSSERVKMRIKGIRDFRRKQGLTMYLVIREGYTYDTWVTENAIENLDVVAAYKEKVLADSGYSIVESENATVIESDPADNQQPETDSRNKRLSRTSKTRAVMALRQPEPMDEDVQQEVRGKKRRSAADNGTSTTIASINGEKRRSQSKGTGRKTKAEVLMEKQLQDRLERKADREAKDGDAIIRSMDHIEGKDCCLKCASSTYRRLLEKGDLEGFKKCFEDVRNIPSHSQEDAPNGLHLIPYAIVLEKFDFAEFATKFKPDTNVSRPEVPTKYVVYDDNTGHNRGGRSFGNRNFRQVQESRGNRLGNSAFYGKSTGSLPRKSYMNVEDVMKETNISDYMPFINKEIFKKTDVINNFLNIETVESNKFYFVVAAGNRTLAGKLLDRNVEISDRSTFNHLHQEVLKLDGKQALTTYRRPQILKMASDAFNITPYHCAAIHSSATYLTEFFDTLDQAERLQTDTYGRTVAFFAAVSDTTDCLEFLISKHFNVTMHDKFKMTPLIQAARYGKTANVQVLINHQKGDEAEPPVAIFQSMLRNRRTALHYAAFFGHAETCRVLIQNNCPVDVLENLDKQTPLHFATKNGYLDCVRVLIEEGHANPEKGDKFGRNPLHLACIYGHVEIAYYLLSIGVDADAPDSSHNYSTHYAAAYGYMDILHLLIQYGSANPALPNVWTSTPCSVANMKGHVAIVKYLLQLPGNPIDVNFKDQEGCIMLQRTIDESVASAMDMELNLNKAKLLLSMNANVNSKDIEGSTSLHRLAANTTYAKLLPKDYRSIYPEKKQGYGYHAMSSAKGHPKDDMEGIKYQLDMAKLLIDHGADLNATNLENETPLATAMRHKNHSLVALLIKKGSKFWHDTDKEGNTFFHYFATLAARVNSMRPHGFEENEIKRQRFVDAAETIWQAVQAVVETKKLDFEDIVNKPNDKGYPFFVWGVSNAISCEKALMISEKRLISCALESENKNSGIFGYYSSSNNVSWVSSIKIDEYSDVLDFDFRFDFAFFVASMQKLLSISKPDLDQRVVLPKDFKKEKPDAKRANYPAFTGFSALHFACQTQCTDLIEFVLYHGASPNTRVVIDDWLGDTPMLMACHTKQDKNQELPDKNLETMEKLDKKFKIIKPDFEMMLHETIQLLLQYGACPFIINADKISPLFKIASSLNAPIVKLMCDTTPSRGTDINIKNDKNKTVFTVALDPIIACIEAKKEADISLVQSLLLKNADPNVVYEDGDTAFIKAVKTSHLPLVNAFLKSSVFPINHNCQNKSLQTALSIACELNNKDILATYLKNLMDKPEYVKTTINTLDSKGCTALSYACMNGNATAITILLHNLGADPSIYKSQHAPLCEAVKSGDFESVKCLLDYDIDLNEYDENRNTPLHNAVLVEKHRIVDLLLSHSADCHLINAKQQTPLHLAVDIAKKQTNRSFRVERSLIRMGADINATDFLGRTPLHYMFVDSNTIPLTRDAALLQKKVKLISQEIRQEEDKQNSLASYASQFDLNEHPNNDNMAQLNAWLKDAKSIQLNKQDEEKKKPGSTDQELLMTEQEKHEIRAYHTYKWEAENDIPERFDPIDIFKFLSSYNELQYDQPDQFGRRPLHYAACVGAFSCSTLLIAKGIDMNAVDSDNNNALQLALRNNYIDYSVMLCNLGASVELNMTIRDGSTISTLGYSLSKSLINVAYLIMDKGCLLIESIRDALQNGKFQMAELLLNSVDDRTLCETSTGSGQNMWHILADFKPFDRDIWQDYIDEFVSRIKTVNPPFIQDSYNRTPLHYAAKHGQDLLLQRLVKINDIGLNINDVDGKSEIDYAVEACQIDCVKIILDAGAGVIKCLTLPRSHKSVLLLAVEKQQYDIAKLLLEQNALTDDGDSAHGRPTCVMMACQLKDLKMLQLLVNDFNANPNTPCYIERHDKHGKPCQVLVHPIFIASQLTDESFLETLLKAGADPNVYGPTLEPENGQSCFMYNVALKHTKHQEILLKYNVDLNSVDPITKRSIFYQFFFDIMASQSSNYIRRMCPDLSFNTTIYEKMLQMTLDGSQVNHVDSFTNMTPLEFAIRDKKPLLVTRLLSFGADPNIESCANSTNTSFAHVANPRGIKLPGILHAIMQNNTEILMLIFNQTKNAINMEWKDHEGNNILSYMAGAVSGYSHCNSMIMDCVFGQMPKTVFKKLLRLKNSQGISPILYAYHRQDKTLYDMIVAKDSSATDYALKNYNTETFPQDSKYLPMDVDHIPLVQVDHDAQIEREKLQSLKDLEKAQDPSSKAKEEDEKLKVDPYAKLSKVGALALNGSGQPYDVMLMKVELNSWGSNTDTSFYKLSIIFNKVLSVYILWTRWGPFGSEGQHQKTPFLTKEEAVTEFKSIFKAKTGNEWDNHEVSFEAKPNRYEIMKVSHHPKDTIIKNFDFLETFVPSNLPSELFDAMKLICNFTYLSRVYSATQIDMPLGQVPQKRIEDARILLNETSELVKTYNELKVCYTDKAKIQESKVYAFKIAQNCVAYSRLLPRYGEENKVIRSLYNHNNSAVSIELSKLADLSYVGFAANVMLAAKHHIDTTNPLEYAFRTLDCSLRPMSPSYDANQYQLISKYMNSTSKSKFELIHLFEVNRANEEERFRSFAKSENRKLLWHGSRIGNIMGILKQGLRVTPRTTTTNGALMGYGVYFADTFSKSLNYCTEDYGSHRSAYKLMFLCEVALGTERLSGDRSVQPNQPYDSKKGQGLNIPDPENAVYDETGLCIPIGPCIPFVQSTSTEPGSFTPTANLNFNEWAVFNEDRIKIRYLLIIKEARSCSLCFTPDIQRSLLKPYVAQEIKDYNYGDFNSYEAEIVKAYLTHTNKTPQDIYKEDVENFMNAKGYEHKWKVPLDLQKDSKICCTCAKKITTVLLDQRIARNSKSDPIIDKINKKPRCKYGKECRSQASISHVTNYKHWFKRNIADDPNTTAKSNELNDDDYKPKENENTDDESEDDDADDSMEIDED
ncbi:hypothetical protein [Parasitella parasitica]|uniref:Poly [ADP-ribose] polymerase n=1 Tax=Parasitella parasitica TaxID=35722 RepID=A0A0B7NSQ5_9FUNG|nr:hypothetical protein [Parasitella parasitica]